MMSIEHVLHRRHGFVLLEALIALLILAVGLLALGQFQGRLMQTSGESKLVSEAVHLAQRKIDQLRSLDWGHADLVEGSDHQDQAVDGTNAVFRVVWEVKDVDGIKEVTVRVVLPDDNDRQVTAMHTWVAEGSEIVLAFEQTGGALVNLNDLDEPQLDLPAAVDDIRIGDYQDQGSGQEYIVIADEESGLALLVEGSSGGGGSGNGFARISGNIFVEDPNAFDPANYQIGITGAALCRVFPSAQDLTLDQTTIAGSNYRLLGYSCFVPHDWQGFIRLRAPSGVCIGSIGDVDGSGRLVDGPLPQGVAAGLTGAQIDRYYVGVDEFGVVGGAGIPGSPLQGGSEIGSVCLVASDCVADVTRNLVPGGHHFLVTELDANANESISDQCRTKILALDDTDYVQPDAYRSNPFWDNPSNLVCVAGECKGATGTATRFRPRFGGFFTNPVGMDHETLAVVRGYSCQSFGPFDTHGGTYWCAVNEGVLLGQIVPSSAQAAFDADPSNDSILISDADANKDRYYFSTQSIPKTAGVSEADLDIAKTIHFTNMNYRVLSGSSDELEPGNGNGNGNGNGTTCSVVVEGSRGNASVFYSVAGSPETACDLFGPPNRRYSCGFNAEPETAFYVRQDGTGANAKQEFANTGLCLVGDDVTFTIDF